MSLMRCVLPTNRTLPMTVLVIGTHKHEMRGCAEQNETPGRIHCGFVPALVLCYSCFRQFVGRSVLTCASGRPIRSSAFRRDNPPPGSPGLATHAITSAHPAC